MVEGVLPQRRLDNHPCGCAHYRGTSLIRKCLPLGPYRRRPMPMLALPAAGAEMVEGVDFADETHEVEQS